MGLLETPEIELTCRSWGIDGAGKENRPRATTVWNSHKGTKIILQVKVKKILKHAKITQTKKM